MSNEHRLLQQLPLGINLPDGASFESFFAGPNAAALDSVVQVSQEGTGLVYLWGGVGTGKTHLLQSACKTVTETGQRAAYLPLSELAFLDPGILDGWESLRLVAVDDINRIAGFAAWEHSLFRLFNELHERSHALLLAADAAPGMIEWSLPDLASRLGWGPVYQLQALDDDERLAALQQRAARRGMELPEESGRYLLKHMRRDMASLCAALDQLDTASLAAQRRLTLPFVKSVITAGGRPV